MSFFRIYFLFIFLIYCWTNAQCASTNIISNLNPVCEDQFIGVQSSGIIKIELAAVGLYNKHVFSTVGESNGDTFLSLYNSAGTLLVENDNDVACGGCKQSTITYGPILGGGNENGLYLILSKPNCEAMDFSTNLKFSARNDYDEHPDITNPTGTVQCIGSKVIFEYSLPLHGVEATNLTTPWSSEDTSVATINESTGEANFIKNGIAKIKLSVKGSCPIINNYIVKGSLTSIINH